MVIGLFISTTALTLPEPAGTSEPLGVVVEKERMSDTSLQVAVTATSLIAAERQPRPADTVLASPVETTVVTDPSAAEIAARRVSVAQSDGLSSPSVEEFDHLWSSGIDLFSPIPESSLPDFEPTTPDECFEKARGKRLDGGHRLNLIAQMTHELFECVTSLEGLDDVEATALRRWNGAKQWGFQSLAEQVAAEAVVVAYCESLGFADHALSGTNPWGYGGLFQLGRTEFNRFDVVGGSRFDPADNAYAAVRYFVFQYENRAGWGGWSPWAVVNTNFDGVNDQVKVPILPRFVSTDPDFVGRRGPELPKWAVDPWTYAVPEWNGCPYNGYRWPRAERL